MAKPIKSDIVSDMMRGTQIVKAISDALRNKGGNDSVLLQLLDPQSPYPAMIADMLMPQKPQAAAPKPVLLDGSRIHTTVQRQNNKFIPRDHFTRQNKQVKIAWVSDMFIECFGNQIDDFGELSTSLDAHTLARNSLNTLIINELGGEDRVKTDTADVFWLMAKQPNGEAGVLLTDGRTNVFYVRDANGVLRVVYVFWRGDGWCVSAYSVGVPDEWSAGDRVFSRGS